MSTTFTCPVVVPVVKNVFEPLMKLHLYVKDFIVRKQKTTEVVKLIEGYSDTWVWLQGSIFFFLYLHISYGLHELQLLCFSVPNPVKEDFGFERYDVCRMK